MADAEHAALLIYQVDVSIHLLIVCLFQFTTSLTVFGDECRHKYVIGLKLLGTQARGLPKLMAFVFSVWRVALSGQPQFCWRFRAAKRG
jgi:hypothetical protein